MHGTEDINDILNNDVKSRQAIEHIRSFTTNKNERRFLMAYLGIGEFKGSKLKGLSSKIAIENGLSFYRANQLLENFRKFYENKGMI